MFVQRCKEAGDCVNPERVWMDIGGYMNSPQSTLDQMKAPQTFPGTVLCSYRKLGPENPSSQLTLQVLQTGLQTNVPRVPELPWKKRYGILKGRVLDHATRSPIYNAEVRLSGAVNRTVCTKPHGSYAFLNLPPGKYKIHLSSSYKELVRKVEVEAGRVRFMDFE